jgi:hypothetical protein
MTLFSEGIASQYLLLQLIRELEASGILTTAQVEDVLKKAIERATLEFQGGKEDHPEPREEQEFEIAAVEIAAVEIAIEILKDDLEIIREAREPGQH